MLTRVCDRQEMLNSENSKQIKYMISKDKRLQAAMEVYSADGGVPGKGKHLA